VTARPERIRIDFEIAGHHITECYNGKSAWRHDEKGLRTLLGSEARSLRLLAVILNSRLRNLSRDRVLPVASGAAEAEGKPASFIELQLNETKAKLFFDSKDGSLVRIERDTSDGGEILSYSGQRTVDQILEPSTIRIQRGQHQMAIAYARAEHNQPIDESMFRYPQIEGAAPLPNLESMMRSVIANQEHIEELRERYTFRETETERKLDRDGRVKESDTRVFEVTPIGRSFVKRLVKIGDKDLSPSELEKEDQRVQKRIEEIQKRDHKHKERAEKANEKGEDDEEESDRITILSFLRISEITSVRREMFRGHEVVAFDFEPKKGFKAKSRAETIINKLAGTIWVDEQALQVARLEARLTDSFKFGGGLLASILPSTAFVFEQEKVGGELWLPSHTEANLAAKIFILAKLNRSMTSDYSEYKKYKIDSEYKSGSSEPKKPQFP